MLSTYDPYLSRISLRRTHVLLKIVPFGGAGESLYSKNEALCLIPSTA